MASRRMIAGSALVWLMLGPAGCASKNDPDRVANGFVDAYYIEFDLDRAKGLATGGAARRIEGEAKLVAAVRKDVQVESRKARVYYDTPVKRAVGSDKVHYTYRLDVRQRGSRVEREAIVMVAKRGGVWKVLRFREAGGGGPLQKPGTSTVTGR